MQYLAVNILGAQQANLTRELCQLIANYDCSILTSRIAILGHEFSAGLLVSGSWNAIAKLESGLVSFEKKHDIRCLSRRTQRPTPEADHLPYAIFITAREQADTVSKIMQFLSEQTLNLYELSVNTYKAPFTETSMLSMMLAITLPASKLLSDFREGLIIFCDENNFDVIIEPQKL